MKAEQSNELALGILDFLFREPKNEQEYGEVIAVVRKEYGYPTAKAIGYQFNCLLAKGFIEKPRQQKAKGKYSLPQRKRGGQPAWNTAVYFKHLLAHFGSYRGYPSILRVEKELPKDESRNLFNYKVETYMEENRAAQLKPIRKAKEDILRGLCAMALFSLHGFHRDMSKNESLALVSSSAGFSLTYVDKLRAVLKLQKLPPKWRHHVSETIAYILGDLNGCLDDLPEEKRKEFLKLAYEHKEKNLLSVEEDSPFQEKLASLRRYYMG